ncbi:MAG: cell division protein [Gammaproteobacteria bacterium]
MKPTSLRTWAIRWLYAAVVLHVIVGALLPWWADLPQLNAYHHGIEAAFWKNGAPLEARAQQLWWMALLGATVQAAAVWMGALVWIGARQRGVEPWAALIAGLLLWAPQDMLISLRAGCWSHVWVDCAALAGMLPPLFYLVHCERRAAMPRREVAP